MMRKRKSSGYRPLDDTSLLFIILSYVGPGQHFFVSTVCNLWHKVYAATGSLEMTSLADDPVEESFCTFMCTPQTTLSSALFASDARLRLADEYFVILEEASLARIAGRVADVATLQVAVQLGMGVPEMMKGAAHAGCVAKLNFLEDIWASSTQDALPDDLCAYAASSGSEEALRWLDERGLLQTDTVLLQAAKFGHVNLLEYVYSEDYELEDDLLPLAARNGHKGAVEWLFEHGAPYDAATICGDAAESGNLELVQFVNDNGGEINESTIRDAALRGHLALCQHLHSRECPWDEQAVTSAGGEGHTEVVKWLVEQGCPYDAADVCTVAAEYGHLAVIQHMLQLERLSLEQMTELLSAAAANDLLVAQWLAKQGACWPATLTYGEAYWSPEAVAWARVYGCTSPL
jgi:hypothetical protein